MTFRKGEILMKKRILALTLAPSLFLTACGGEASATTMRLKKAEGRVRQPNPYRYLRARRHVKWNG